MGGDITRGINAWKHFATGFLTALSDMSVEIEDTVAEKDTTMVRLTVRGVHTGDIWGIPPTNRRVSLRVATLYRFVEGKMVELWGFQDRLGLMQQLGAIP